MKDTPEPLGTLPRRVKMLLALDGTHSAKELLGKLKWLPTANELEIILLHCLDLNSLPFSGGHGYQEELEAKKSRCQAFLDRETAKVSELGYGKTSSLLAVGPARQGVLDAAHTEDVDFIVLQTHGRGGLEWLFLGSVTEGVIRRSSCPVIVVPPDPHGSEALVDSLVL